jgi:glycosyltransferase involved in cell wall biosynthesis
MPEAHAARMRQPFQSKWEWGKLFGWLLGARRTLQDANAIICVGRDEYEAMRTAFPDKPVFYLPNGVEINRFKQGDASLFRNKYGIASNERLVLCVSRIDYQKNQVLLVRSFARFAKKHPDYKLVLIGPINVESYHQEIVQTASDLGIADRLLLIPGLEPGDPLLASAYRAADCFVLPSKMEPFGIVILEAWAAGLPVIASNVGGIPGFTHDGQDILLFPSEDEAALVDRLERLATEPSLRAALIEGGRATVQAYSWEAIADQLLAIYLKVL